MCNSCDQDTEHCRIYQDDDNDFYLEIQTFEWDSYNDDWFYERIYITHCPWCGRKLGE